jgi:hypothetical protein
VSAGSARRLASAALFASIPALAGSASAQQTITEVIVLRPPTADVALAEIATRAWAELTAEGITARLLDCPIGQVSCPVEALTRDQNSISLRTFRQANETITEAALTPPATITLSCAGH